MKYGVLFIIMHGFLAYGQKGDTLQKIDVYLEYRPRIEYREGYKNQNDSSNSALIVSHRARLSMDFEIKKFRFHGSIQDVRIWGEQGQNSNSSTLSVFEAYLQAELSKNWSIKLGRQSLELDNGRLFSRANWSQSSRAHDGINLRYNSSKINAQLVGFYNQSYVNSSGTYYTLSSKEYKFLFVHHFHIKLNKFFELSTLNSFDGYEKLNIKNVFYVRGTSGLRLRLKTKNIEGILSGYYQYGQLQSGQKISSYYYQPELKVSAGILTTRLGAEVLSGDNQQNPSTFSNSFSTLYGVAFKFNGNINYFTVFPSDVSNGGLINPYLFFLVEPSKKWKIKMEQHLFYLQNKALNNQNEIIGKYLGYENDIKIRYKVNPFTSIQAGFSLIITTTNLKEVRGVALLDYPYWSYVMLTFKPQILKSRRKAIF